MGANLDSLDRDAPTDFGYDRDMKVELNWKAGNRRESIMMVLTVVLVIVLASHPELRLFLPLVDALGLDLLLLLVSMQFVDYLRPLMLLAQRRVLIPLARSLYRSSVFFLGVMGPFVAGRIDSYLQGGVPCPASKLHEE